MKKVTVSDEDRATDIPMGSLPLPPYLIVGIGGSAGALNAYKALFEALPSDTGMAFVIVSHLHPDAHCYLAEILSRHTNMTVIVAATAMPIEANYVYVIPADADLTVESYAFKVVSPRARRGTQVDLFFISLAEAIGAKAIGIVLSGYGGDGTAGCRHIKAKGGKTFAQDSSAEVDGMPLRALASGFVDFVLPPDKISDELQRLILLRRHAPVMGESPPISVERSVQSTPLTNAHATCRSTISRRNS